MPFLHAAEVARVPAKCALLALQPTADHCRVQARSEQQVPAARGSASLKRVCAAMVAATEAVPQPVIGHMEQPQAMAQQLQLTPPQRKGTDPAAAPAQPPTSPVAADGLGQLFRRQQR